MRLLFVISSVKPASGGPAEVVKVLTADLQETGHAVEILTLDAPNKRWLEHIKVKTHAIGPSILKYSYSPRLIPWLRKNVKAYNAVIVMGIWQFTSFAVWRILRRANTPYFVYTHGMLSPWFNHAFPFKHIKKCLYWPWAEYRVLRDAKAVLSTSEDERLSSRNSFRPYKCTEETVAYGTALPPQDKTGKKQIFFNKFPDLKDKRLILFMGRLHPKKGCDLLVKAFSGTVGKNQDFHLVMSGQDQVGWKGQLEKLSEKLGIRDKITWTGVLTGDCKWGAFYASEVFVLPSHQENFGISVVEALGCATPVLISNKIGIWREIERDKAGFVGDNTLQGTEELLIKWQGLDEAERTMISKRAKDCFIRFNIREAAQGLIQVLKKYGVS